MEGNFMPRNHYGNAYENQMFYNQNSQSGVNLSDFEHETSFEHQTEQYVKNDSAFSAAGPSIGPNKLIKIGIFDRSSPNGVMVGLEKKTALMQALFEMMYNDLLSEANIKPRFNWSNMVDNVFRAIAVGEATAEWLKDRVENMPPPWPGAKLYVVYKTSKLTKVEAYVPGKLLTRKQLFRILWSFDRMIKTVKWTELGVRPHGQGHVFTFAIDVGSYNLLDQYRGYVPYGDSGIEFRVLKDECI